MRPQVLAVSFAGAVPSILHFNHSVPKYLLHFAEQQDRQQLITAPAEGVNTHLYIARLVKQFFLSVSGRRFGCSERSI